VFSLSWVANGSIEGGQVMGSWRTLAWFGMSLLGPRWASAQEASGNVKPEPGTGQDSVQPAVRSPKEVVELRVSSTGASLLVGVDRGKVDGLVVGDRVRFFPLAGKPIHGRVDKVFERIAMVRLFAGERTPALGTRGRVLVPGQRVKELASRAVEQPLPQLPWEATDDDWTPDQPLLTPMEVVNPNRRQASFQTRIVLQGLATETDGLASDRYYRTGVDWRAQNALGHGGRMQMDLELNRSDVDLPDGDGENQNALRVDRLSYAIGGTRFSPMRLEAGRFLQYGMPEFGVLDGAEWSERRADGSSYGFSAGFQPAPDPDYRSGNDFQLAGYYRWVSDVEERMVASAGFQKSWHNGAPDRDLLVGSFSFLPRQGWDAHVSAWLDLYGANEQARNAGLGLTRVIADSSQEFADGSRLTLSFLHQEFADIQRFEGLAPSPTELASLRSDRVGARLTRGWRAGGRWSAGMGLWNDEDDSGGDLELGYEKLDWLRDASRAGCSAFLVQGKFSTIAGVRGTYSLTRPEGTWTVLLELSDRFEKGFASDVDEILQHRMRGSYDAQLGSGWSLSLYGEGRSFDDALSVSAGFYLQRYL